MSDYKLRKKINELEKRILRIEKGKKPFLRPFKKNK